MLPHANMSSINKICEQCNKAHDSVKSRSNNLILCDSCDKNRLRAQRHEWRSKNLTVEAANEPADEARSGSGEDEDDEGNQSSHISRAAPPPEKPVFADRHCIDDCKVQGLTADLEMVRCCLCARWYHIKCMALPPDELGVWPCPDCRHLARDVKSTKTDIQKLVTAINGLTDVLRIQSENHQSEKRNLELKIQQLEKENAELSAKNNEFENKFWESSCGSQKAPNISASKTLVIGSSLVRNLDEAKIDRSEVRSLSGAKMRDIATELEAMASDGVKYSRVAFLAGGNDASQPIESMDLEGTMAAFNDAVKAAKELSSGVAVTEIPPRSQPPHAKDNIAALKANIVAAAAELSIACVSNQNYFLLQSNDTNDGYFYDHVHLTIKGSDKLASAMGLKSKSYESFSSLRPQQTAPQTRPRPYPRPRPRPAQRPPSVLVLTQIPCLGELNKCQLAVLNRLRTQQH